MNATNDARGIIDIYAIIGLPRHAFKGMPRFGHHISPHWGRGAVCACGTDHLPHDDVIARAVDGDALIGDIYFDIIFAFRHGAQLYGGHEGKDNRQK